MVSIKHEDVDNLLTWPPLTRQGEICDQRPEVALVLHTYFHPDFIEHQFGSRPTIEGVQSKIEDLRQTFPDIHFSIDELVAQEDKVWLRMTARGTNQGGFQGAPPGRSFEITVFDQLRFRDGLIVEHRDSPDRFAMMVQLGSLPQGMLV